MTSYKELGLVNTKEMFAKAVKGGYAIPAYNFNNMEQLQSIIQACVETKSPVILQVSKGARDYANLNLLRNMAKGASEYAKELGYEIPIVLHLDHGDSFETCMPSNSDTRMLPLAGFCSLVVGGAGSGRETGSAFLVASTKDAVGSMRSAGFGNGVSEGAVGSSF